MAHGGLWSGSRWVCGVARGGGSNFWSILMVFGVSFFVFLFYVAPNTQCKIFAALFS